MISKKIKNPFLAYHLLSKKNYLLNEKNNTTIKTWSRASTILPCMLNTVLLIYNGKKHLPLQITEEIIGYKLGEFIPTKTFYSHFKKEKKLKHL